MNKIASKRGQIGKEHHAWKGNDVSYSALHSWVRRELGNPVRCKKCGSSKYLQWANKSHKYKRDLADWVSLCSKCHMDFDGYKRWVRHIKNCEKKCYCGKTVWANAMCQTHNQQYYRKERESICLV